MISVNVSGGGGVVANVGGPSQPSIAVSPGGSLSGVSVSSGGASPLVSVSAGATAGLIVSAAAIATTEPTSISVAPNAGPPTISIGGGVGPAAVVSTTGEIVGVNPFTVAAGQNITVSQVSGTYVVSGVPDSHISSKAPVQLVQGRTGSVTIVAADITAGVFDVARIPVLPSQNQVISTGSLSSVSQPQQDFIAKGTIVTTADGRRWVYSGVGAKTTESSYVELADITPEWSVIANKPLVFAPETHSHAPEAITGGVVTSVQGRTGGVVLSRGDLTAAAAIHTHSTTDVVGLTSMIQSLVPASPVFSVQGKVGNVVLYAEDVTAAPATHSHPYVHSISGATGALSLTGSGGVQVATQGGTITISGSGTGVQWYSPPPQSPDWVLGSVGDVARDDENFYVCVKSDPPGKWRRAPLSTWTPTDPLFAQVELLLHFSGLGNLTDSSPLNRTVTGPSWSVWGGVFDSSGYNSIAFYGNSESTPPLVVPEVMDPEDPETAIASWSFGTTYAIEFWVQLSSCETRTKIIGTGRWGIHATYQSATDDFKLEFLGKNSSGAITTTRNWGTISKNQWTFVCFTGTDIFVGTTMGQPATRRASTGLSLSGGGTDLTIGGDENGRIDGKIDEVRITRDIRYTPVNYWDPNSVVVIVPAAKFPDA